MMLPLCKCYRYLIYRLYHFRDDTPTTNVLVTLATVHLFQFLTIIISYFTIRKNGESLMSSLRMKRQNISE
jgi:hypothetical protein